MTDNEIIKALECCKELICKDCPIFPNSTPVLLCKSRLEKEALDLIKRQQAEIEELESDNGVTQYLLSEAWEGIEEKDKWFEKRESIVKAEAITEFAERLKAEILEWQYEFEYYDERKRAAKQVDNLVKEMTEGDNGYTS